MSLRETIGARVEAANLEHDISRLSADMNYHKFMAQLFGETIKEEREELSKVPGRDEDWSSKEDYR